ncbi:hypothetical protein FQA39_LY12034 [Lamprigera yunnana]|nr:hypothetical protein FQA39_LY12034 [Lamprigera yunnana]
MALQLEPHQGLLFAEFLNPMISRRRKRKQEVKNFLCANQMNINVATWGRLLKRSAPGIQQNRVQLDEKPETPGETPDPYGSGLVLAIECGLGGDTLN